MGGDLLKGIRSICKDVNASMHIKDVSNSALVIFLLDYIRSDIFSLYTLISVLFKVCFKLRVLASIIFHVVSPYEVSIYFFMFFQFDAEHYYNSCTMKSCCFAGDNDQFVLSGSDDFNLYMWKIPESNSGSE